MTTENWHHHFKDNFVARIYHGVLTEGRHGMPRRHQVVRYERDSRCPTVVVWAVSSGGLRVPGYSRELVEAFGSVGRLREHLLLSYAPQRKSYPAGGIEPPVECLEKYCHCRMGMMFEGEYGTCINDGSAGTPPKHNRETDNGKEAKEEPLRLS